MGEREWQVVYRAMAQVEAEIIRGMLEAQDLKVLISQEGYAGALGVTVDLGQIEVLVPNDQVAEAERILSEYESGEMDGDGESGSEGEAE